MSGAMFRRKQKRVISMVKANPEVTYEDVQKQLILEFDEGCKLATFNRWKSISQSDAPRRKRRKARKRSVKSELKEGSIPLKTEVKNLGKTLLACGIEEATFRVIDGVPQWHLTEKRSFTL